MPEHKTKQDYHELAYYRIRIDSIFSIVLLHQLTKNYTETNYVAADLDPV